MKIWLLLASVFRHIAAVLLDQEGCLSLHLDLSFDQRPYHFLD